MRNNWKKNSKKLDRLKIYICNHTQVVNSDLKMNILISRIIEKVRKKKTKQLFIQIPIRKLQNYLIKNSSEGGFGGARSESGDVIIKYSSLRTYVPP